VRTELQRLEKPVQLANDGIVGLDQRAAQARQSSGEQDVAIRVYDHMLVRKSQLGADATAEQRLGRTDGVAHDNDELVTREHVRSGRGHQSSRHGVRRRVQQAAIGLGLRGELALDDRHQKIQADARESV